MSRGNAKIGPENPDGLFLGYQSRWVKDQSRLKLMEKARQIGISWGTAYAVVERTGARGARMDQWLSSRDDMQARLFIEDCKMFGGVLQLAAEDLGEQIIDEGRNSAHVIKFANGRRIHSMSSNPDAQAGKRGGRVLDEFALHPDPRKLWTIAYPGITWGGNLEVISTHRGSNNFFADLIREITERGNPKGISHHKVTIEDALADGFLAKLQAALPQGDERLAMDEAAYYDFIRAGCADEESFQQEYMCRPADDNAAFLTYDMIAACESDTLIDDLADAAGPLYVGVDIGRKHDLTVVWVLEAVGDVLATRQIHCMKNMPKPEQEKVLWPVLDAVNVRRACLDATGLGIGWVDDAKAKYGEYRVEGVTFTPRTKETLAYPLRGRFEDRGIRIPFDPKIRADLRAVTKETTSAGNVRFTAERTPDGHADRFWALALAVHAAGGKSPPVAFGSADPAAAERMHDETRRREGAGGFSVRAMLRER